MSRPAHDPTIHEALVANMHDGDDGGVVTMPVKALLDETVEVLRDFLLDEEMVEAIHLHPERALTELVRRLGGLPTTEERT